MTEALRYLRAVVLDWAGTTVDHGSRAPASVFLEIFRRQGVPITIEQAREPMGKAKRDHIAAIAAMPEVDRAWREIHGRGCSDADIDEMYERFLPLQKETLQAGCDVIDGVRETVAWCRERGLKIGSTTGYTRELMGVVTPMAAKQGYTPDCVLCAEDAPAGRPAPFLLFTAAMRLNVYPMWRIVKVDDTPVGIEAGRNAGCWTVGVTRTGNGVGLSAAEVQALDADDLKQRCDAAGDSLRKAGAHYLIESVADLSQVLLEIDSRAGEGKLPMNC